MFFTWNISVYKESLSMVKPIQYCNVKKKKIKKREITEVGNVCFS